MGWRSKTNTQPIIMTKIQILNAINESEGENINLSTAINISESILKSFKKLTPENSEIKGFRTKPNLPKNLVIKTPAF